ncbi:MAG: zinc-binding dehydrogenase [Proteobacteria bacterium]|nr:zinc-binding dehydrogenase [Pseudomonadota bacterium]
MAIPKSMKAVLTRGHGGVEMLDYCEVPTPAPGRDEVLVEVSACGLNNTDIWNREGKYGTDRDPAAVTGAGRAPGRFPVIQGADVAGRIVAVGEGVDAARIGDRVICNFVHYAPNPNEMGFAASLGSPGRAGGYAQYTVVRTENAYGYDGPLSDAELATFPCAYITAEHMLEAAGVEAGQLVLVTGASGGVGSALIQLVNARGAEAIAATSARWAEDVAGLKPRAVVLRDGKNGRDFYDQVREAAGGAGVHVVADIVGGPHFTDCLALLRKGGCYVSAGAIAGPVVPFDLRTMYLNYLRLVGVSIGYARHFDAVMGHIEAGRVKPLLAASYPLSEIRAAQEKFMSKDFFGNIVVLPQEG